MASSAGNTPEKSIWPILIGALAVPLADLFSMYLAASVNEGSPSNPFLFVQQFVTLSFFWVIFAFLIPFQIALGAIIGLAARRQAKTERGAIWIAAIAGVIIGVATGCFGLILVLMGYI